MRDKLFRQVHPSHLINGLSSGAFRPTPNDEEKLSVDCANMTSAKASYELHLQKTKALPSGDRVPLETSGTWAINRDICETENLPVIPDPIENEPFQPDNSAHHLVDFSTAAAPASKKTIAKRLRLKAAELGKLWPEGD